MTTKSCTQVADKFSCFMCDYYTSRKSSYDKHNLTVKHFATTKSLQNIAKVAKKHTCECGKEYKHHTSLWNHRQKCNFKHDPPEILQVTDASNNVISSELVLELLKQNNEFKSLIAEQNKHILELMEKGIGNTINTNCNNITNKNKFNLNIFLNEQCKDAINMGDFIKSLKITFHDLEITRDKSLEESVSTIMLRGLKELDVYKRPIHCTDQKRDVMYIKDEEKWEKDDGNVKLKESIDTLSKKQMFTLKEWRDSDPELKTNDDKRDKFVTTLNHVCTPIPETSGKRLIKTIGKEIYIDKLEE